jgi:hypothetical protein
MTTSRTLRALGGVLRLHADPALVVALVVLAAAGLCSPALGDADDWEIRGWTTYGGTAPYVGKEPKLGETKLEGYADVLGLSGEARDLLYELHAGYSERHESVWLSWAEAVADNNAAQGVAVRFDDWTAYHRIDARSDEAETRFRREAEELRQAFLEDVRLLVLDDDPEAWASIERYERRSAFFYSPRSYSGPSAPSGLVDLLGVLEAISDQDENDAGARDLGESVRVIAERYERSLDSLITRTQAARDRLTNLHKQRTAAQADAFDDDADQQTRDEALERLTSVDRDTLAAALDLRDATIALHELTDRAVTDIRRVLPPDTQERFDKLTASSAAGQRPGAPGDREQRSTRIDRIINEVKPVLTAEQTRLVDELERAYDEQRSAILVGSAADRARPNRPVRDADKFEAEFDGGAITIFRIEPLGQDDDADDNYDMSESVVRAMHRLDQEYVDRLRELLSEEQRMRIASY